MPTLPPTASFQGVVASDMISSWHFFLQTEQPQVPQLLPAGLIIILWFTGDNGDSQFSGISC